MYLFIQAFQNYAAANGKNANSVSDMIAWYNTSRGNLSADQNNKMDICENAKFAIFHGIETAEITHAVNKLATLDPSKDAGITAAPTTANISKLSVTGTGSSLPNVEVLRKRANILDRLPISSNSRNNIGKVAKTVK